jgi:hypothetical protein
MTQHHSPTNLWGDAPRSPHQPHAGGSFHMGGEHAGSRRSGDTNWLKTIFKFAVFAGVVYAGWHYGQPLYQRYRVSSDVEKSAGSVLGHLPKKCNTEEELRSAVADQISGVLAGHYAGKARWYVCFGARGEDVRVMKDDHFDKSGKAFVERLIDEGRLKLDTAGAQHDAFTWPMGVVYETIHVGEKPYCVAVGWTEAE